MIEKVEKVLKEKNLIKEGEGIILGISGGADSVCLALCLKKIFERRISLLAIHVNHGIRGEEAKRDEDFVKEFCERLAIPLVVKHFDVPKIAKEKRMSEEEAGRLLRYQTFDEVRREEGYHKIAVAHNKEDAVETFLLNLARGSALQGLTGMKERNGEIIRPLISISRSEIEEFLRKEGEGFVVDSSNLSSDYTRNVIRNQILRGFQEGVNERTVEHIIQTIEFLKEADAFIKKKAEAVYTTIVEERENGRFLPEEVRKCDFILQKEVIYKALSEVAGKKKDISRVHVEGVARLFDGEVSKKIDLPYGMEAIKNYEGVWIRKKEERKKKALLWKLKLETEEIGKIARVKREESDIVIELADGEVKKLHQSSCIKWFDYDRITDNLVIRTREEGDFLTISEFGGRKKLKVYFIDEKIPREERDEIPLVASGKEILWIVGGRVGEGARIGSFTKKLLKITIEKMEEEVQ